MKKSFITGLIILMPLTLTILLFIFLMDILSAPFLDIVRPWIASSNITEPEIITFLARLSALVLLFFTILALGVVARLFFIKPLLNWANKLLSHIPVVKSIYKITKEIVSALFSPEGRKAFQRPVMLPFPLEESYSVGFYSGEAPPECIKKVNQELSPVFVPTAPHPISGYIILTPKDKLKEIEMTNEEAFKFTVSCGLVTPEDKKENEE